MRLRVLFLSLILVQMFSGASLAQTAGKLNIEMKNTPIEAVLNKIERDTDYRFVYNKDIVNVGQTVSISVKEKNISEVLDVLFKNSPISYSISGRQIVLNKKSEKAAATKATISGVILDESGQPLPGVNIMEKGTTNGSISDLDGKYSVSVSENATLVYSCIGYIDQTLSAKDSETAKVTLLEDSEMLEETVVVGYGTMKRSMVANAISKVKVDDSNMRQVTSPVELLNGRVAGVNISTGSGNLGSGERMTIRGASSISAGNEPLYVVDGIPITNTAANLTDFGEDMSALSVLNLSDIESIEILKDAASAAIYGSRATNGVVIITTKSGREGKTNVRVNVNTGVSQFPNVGKIEMADSKLYLEAYNDGVDNYNKQYGYSKSSSNYMEHRMNPFGNLPDTDWMGQIVQLGKFVNADVSIAGGSKKTNYYIGANYNSKEGVIKTNALEKINLKAKLNHEVSKWLEIGVNTSANYMKNHQIPGVNAGTMIIGRAILQIPYNRPYAPDGSYYTGGTDWLTFHNCAQILNEEVSYIETMRYLGSYFFNLKFWQDRIQFKNTLSTDITQTYDYTFYNENHPYGKGVGIIYDRNSTTNNILFESVLSYNDSFLDNDLNVSAMLGHSFQKIDNHNIRLDGMGYPSPSFDVVGVASEVSGYSGGATIFAMESYFGRVNFGYKGRYILTGSLRTDGSSKFGPAYRWDVFPSVSFGWNVSKEPWMEGSDTDLKFRISYGQTGNQEGIGKYAYQAQMSGGQNYNGESGIATTSFGNESLTWEKSGQFDVGIDLSLLKDKINFIIDGYIKNTNDLLYAKPIYATSGTTSITSNIGSLRNRGIEFSVNTNFDLGKVHWSSSLNIAHNQNEVTYLPDAEDKPLAIGSNRALQVGKEMGAFYLFKFDGIYQYDAEVPKAQYDQGVRAGDVRWRDLDGNEIINDDDRVVVGSSNPDFSGGWDNSFDWKGFNLDIFFTYMYGNNTYMGQCHNINRLANAGVTKIDAENRWTGPGSTNVWPRAIAGNAWNVKNSDRFLYDGSFIRLRSLTLAYNFPRKMISKMNIQALRVFVQGDNLFLLTKYPGWDPEVSSNMDPRFFGIDNLNVPQPRTYTMGLNITF